ncbi:MAG: transglycosylase SLT domain-containing protein [Alphaproteobacteria bacterium]
MNAGKAHAEYDCVAEIRLAEQYAGLPDQLLHAISLTESGRTDPITDRYVAWPYTVTVEGDGQYYSNLNDAINAVNAALRNGIKNIDVGCMQINYGYHGAAFNTLDLMFDPTHNIAYAASFLRQLYRRHGRWSDAIAYYHSSDPVRAQDYQHKVMMEWAKFRVDASAQAKAASDSAAKAAIEAQKISLETSGSAGISGQLADNQSLTRTETQAIKPLDATPAHQNSYVAQQLVEMRARNAAPRPAKNKENQ